MAMVGGIKEKEGTANSLDMDQLARFAVDEHNKKQNALLEFGKVVNVKEQVVSGTMYHITLEATDGGKRRSMKQRHGSSLGRTSRSCTNSSTSVMLKWGYGNGVHFQMEDIKLKVVSSFDEI